MGSQQVMVTLGGGSLMESTSTAHLSRWIVLVHARPTAMSGGVAYSVVGLLASKQSGRRLGGVAQYDAHCFMSTHSSNLGVESARLIFLWG